MIVDNYSDTEIFLKFLHQILEIDILKSDNQNDGQTMSNVKMKFQSNIIY